MTNKKDLLKSAIKASNLNIHDKDIYWSRYSSDKVDIGRVLSSVIRQLNKTIPLNKKMRALSIGSSSEPQFRILEAVFSGGLYLLDINKLALDVVKHRLRRQSIDNTKTIAADYNDIFLNKNKTSSFLRKTLSSKKLDLIALHHSLYYSDKSNWEQIFNNLYDLMNPNGAIHAVMMSSRCKKKNSTTWLYDHFAGKFCNHKNDQDLLKFAKELKKSAKFKKSKILTKTNKVRFYSDDFKKLMAVVWMILLYPEVHKYSLKQREEITEFMYNSFWLKKQPLIQEQDHLIIYNGA